MLGTSDGQGVVRIKVPVHITEVQLLLPGQGIRIPVRVGHLDPIETNSGQKGRLTNLGYHPESYFQLLAQHGID